MSFELTEELKALQEMAHSFAEKEMRPKAALYDREEKFPEEVMQKAFEAGFLTCNVPVEYGGGGLSDLEVAVISEELAWGCAGMYTTMMANSLAFTPIVLFGSEEQKQKFLTPFSRKMAFASYCLTEREAGSDTSAIKTIARKDGSDYVLNGSKCFITNGGVASLYVVFANAAPEKGARGLTAFLVPRETPGLTIGKIEDKMGHRASNTAEIFFEDVRVPAENIIGRVGQGFLIAMRTFDRTRSAVGAAGVGLARAALEYAVDYAKTRVQFGQPIATFQAVAFKIAQMAMEIEAARLLVWKAAWMVDKGLSCGLNSAMAKCFGSDLAMWASLEALQILGGYGYMKDYPVEKLVRDAKLLQIYEGTNEIQRLVISREVIGPIIRK
ncbi:MAG: acyl-CoA dehydrogenase family protein [Candidatus Saccharicenans sp.]|nr:acyl-CoA dehydrogenase family protein [Candidatus Saccharicenans sp.]MDI6849052.1 acyl-CoA dehydrogenase family protein [Candidatus Saccharicenans sp.]